MSPLVIFLLLAATGGLIAYGFSGPTPAKAAQRRLKGVRTRYAPETGEVQMRRIATPQNSSLDSWFGRMIPRPALLRQRLEMTGRSWTLAQYSIASGGLTLFTWVSLGFQGFPLFLTFLLGLAVGVGLPHLVVSKLIARRVAAFTARFPDAIDLLVRGLRSGLPIGETLGVVGHEVPGPVGVEFRGVTDRMRIGRTMDQALQETADRLLTAEFQFFVISLAIQRETGGNLAETLSNLAEVLRKRSQMKLKVKAMSSESKASAWIIGVLPFLVFGLISFINPGYMHGFFHDERLMIVGLGGLGWMGVGVFIMSRMINFEI
ncbi:type II secretion system F family protein [Sphingomonas naphthae]|uniref:Type II secretion system F family protein n=1 Tax=Sphingomonas naphthae TaxID=1813468 RepID=A0ABY7TG05_9SPHN|nr:type II secretion system F family protein [Sphingomonas naphthae]WCT72153.1 type II secretion system F family protein [Sphingomonas naphthae]